MVTSASAQRSTRQARASTRSKEVQTAPADCSGPGGRIKIKARNHLPVSGKANKERREQWRRHIIKCAAGAIDQAAKLGEYGSWLFTVDVEFFLPRETKNDIDNLAKPIIDTLFSPGVPNGNQNREITGKVFPLADDLQVTQLNLRKTLVQSDEECGATITVCWTRFE
jgi:Holliday junction resolvase RusA-like endonuclease